ncbi:hypothetical protein Athai_45770 [Actinocatenispora thailandica]|uniref:Uncharacterized protein n=1 Tax=Actinocatenispora thailandica TaxID=227318 RepID=A0A7R7DSN8_9ACTN|nr:hypothetical protein [Actinocatenispora thailandica]BCJ37074.1 hypothetical protein Athai_45770 [Actinocatenispora thailandica]
MGHQIRAEFGTIDQLAADQSGHAGNIEGLRATLKSHVSKALNTLDGGMGTDEHQACMRKADELIDEYINNTHQFQRTTTQVGDTHLQYATRAVNMLSSGG